MWIIALHSINVLDYKIKMHICHSVSMRYWFHFSFA